MKQEVLEVKDELDFEVEKEEGPTGEVENIHNFIHKIIQTSLNRINFRNISGY